MYTNEYPDTYERLLLLRPPNLKVGGRGERDYFVEALSEELKIPSKIVEKKEEEAYSIFREYTAALDLRIRETILGKKVVCVIVKKTDTEETKAALKDAAEALGVYITTLTNKLHKEKEGLNRWLWKEAIWDENKKEWTG